MKANLRTRIISAIVALLIIVPIIYFGDIVFKIGMLFLATFAYKELLDLKKSHNKIPINMIVFGLFSLYLFIIINNIYSYSGINYLVLSVPMVFLLLPIIFYKNDEYTSNDAFYLIGITFFLALIFNIFIEVRSSGLNRFIFLLLIPGFNDIFAYLIGSKFGKHKMCPNISPNKTWEGSIGGLIFGLIGSMVFYKLFIGIISINLGILILILSIVGQMGDLVFSKIKRENGIKDFSNLMPGHGGLLDRIDSVIFVFLAYMILIVF